VKSYLPFSTIKEIVQKEGWQALYKGLPAMLVAIAASSGVYFFWYHLLMKTITKKRKNIGTLWNLIIAFVAGAINCTCTNPLWVVTSRLQLQRKKAEALLTCLPESYVVC